MKYFRIATLGISLQMAYLALFIVVAGRGGAELGKSVVIVLAALSMLVLLTHAGRLYSLGRTAMLCALLAIGFILAFHLLGLLFFPDLLRDADGWSIDYLISNAKVIATLFVLYFVTTLAMRGLINFFWRQRAPDSGSSR